MTSGGLEKVKVTARLGEMNRAPGTLRKTVLPWVIMTFLIRLKRLLPGFMNVTLFAPWTTNAVMSMGPKVTNVFAPGAESALEMVALLTNGTLTILTT